jgi:uncharacterized protein (TIGR02001 family)
MIMQSHKLTLLSVALLGLSGAHQAVAEDSPHSLSANIGAVSNYMWRGISQTGNGAAVQGGVDYGHSSGFYAGTWISNVDWGSSDPSYELDLYGGFGGDVGEFSWDLNTIYYAYPDTDDANFWEIGASGTFKMFTVGLAYTIDGQADEPAPYRDGDIYYYGSVSFDLPQGFGIGATLGYTDFDDFGSEADYTHWQVSVSKDAGDFGEFSLNYDQNDGGDDKLVATDKDPKFWVGWTKEF